MSNPYETEREATLRAFADKLRLLRKRDGISQEELAYRARLHRVSVGYLEQGRREPNLYTLMILADTFDITVNELLSGIPMPQQRRPARGRRVVRSPDGPQRRRS